MATIFKNVDWTLDGLVYAVDSGTIGLPDIQRPFVWKAAKVRDLFDSMYKGFPVGYLLFWSNDVEPGARQIGIGARQKVPSLLIVDGQQRLTSLYAVLKGKPVVRDDFTTHQLRIAFRPADASFDVATSFIQKDPEYIADISQIWAPEVHLFAYTARFIQRVKKHREAKGAPWSDEVEARIADAIGQLNNLKNYPFTALEVASTANAEQVADIFVRINSKGVPLNQADFILTLMSVHWDAGRRALEAFSRSARDPKAGPFNRYIEPSPDQLLRVAVALGFRRARLETVYSVLRGKDMETGEISEGRRQEQFHTLADAQATVLELQNWTEFLKVPLLAGYRTGSVISSQTALVYTYALYLIGKRDYGVDIMTLRNVIARWYFMASLTARYSSSPESRMEMDLSVLRPVRDAAGFVSVLDRIIDDALTDDYWRITIPNELATASARSPALFAYYAALNLLDARVLFSQLKISELLDPTANGKRAALERHHLFPKRYLKELGKEKVQETNQIANFALVEWPDNAKIAARPPSEYFPEFVQKAQTQRGFNDDMLGRMMHWHALPLGWEKMGYEEFLAARRSGMAEVVSEGWRELRARTGVGPVPSVAS